jgi:hypothetical protein
VLFDQEKRVVQVAIGRNMSAVFWLVTIVMALLAFGFISTPLIRSNRRFGTVGIAVTLPVFAASLYGLVGSPQAASIEVPADTRVQSQPKAVSSASTSVGSVDSMVDGLAERLRQTPDDGKSWLLLARSYNHLKRTAEAKDAYAQAASLGEHDEKLSTIFGSSESDTSE